MNFFFSFFFFLFFFSFFILFRLCRTATVISKASCILLKVPGSVFKTIKKEIDNEASAPLEELNESAESLEVSESTEQAPEEVVNFFFFFFVLLRPLIKSISLGKERR
jgi:hypothetical protein